VIESALEIIKKTLENGDDVLISGFGKFSVKGKRGRRGRNPHTGEELMLDARRVVTFKCSGVLRDKVNGKE
jgi:integration host factor subunit alpha